MVYAYSEYDGICQFISQLNQKKVQVLKSNLEPSSSISLHSENSNELLLCSMCYFEFHRSIRWLKFQLTLWQLCSGRQEVRKQLQSGLSSIVWEAPISQRATNSCITWVDCCQAVSDSLQPHGLQHARLPYSSLSRGVCSKSCPSSQWCHPTISSSVIPFSSCLQSSPASGSLPMTQLFISGGQSIGASV